MVVDGSERLKETIRVEITNFWKGILDYGDIAVPNEYTRAKLRKKVLDLGNDAVRRIYNHLDNYDIKHEPRIDDRIVMEEE